LHPSMADQNIREDDGCGGYQTEKWKGEWSIGDSELSYHW
jgi:hypothetical protein